MARDFARDFYKSERWLKCRSSYIAYRRSVDGGMCERCHEMPGYIVHHKTYLTPDNIDNPDVTLGFGNLEYVCLRCHNEEHNGARDLADDLVQVEFAPDGKILASPPSNLKNF